MKGLLLGLLLTGCLVHRATGPRFTGTCEGACAHYVECKPGHLLADHTRCTSECPAVFTDQDSLMGYEGLTCQDAVEFIDGAHPKTSQR